MTRKNMLISYAADFVSYLLSEKHIENYGIRTVILYGSVVRGDFTDKSDVDIFVDYISGPNDLQVRVEQTVKDFFTSIWPKKWSKLNIKNKISVLAGNLDEWKDLRHSIISNNIVLYGRYVPKAEGKPMVLFSIGTAKPESRRVFLNRKLFGYNRYKKKYAGMLEEFGGVKTGKGCFIVPAEHSKKMLDFLRKMKVPFQLREIFLRE